MQRQNIAELKRGDGDSQFSFDAQGDNDRTTRLWLSKKGIKCAKRSQYGSWKPWHAAYLEMVEKRICEGERGGKGIKE